MSDPTPKRPQGKPPKYSNERKAEIIAAIELEYGGNVNRACKALGIAQSTVWRWYEGANRNPLSASVLLRRNKATVLPALPPQELIDRKRYEITNLFEEIIARYASYINEAELANLKPNVAAVVVGILFDKLQIMRGQPTHITQTNVRYMEQGSLRRMATERLQLLEGGKQEVS